MEVNNTSVESQDGAVEVAAISIVAPPEVGGERVKPCAGNGNRKRRRGKHKRKVTKPWSRPRLWGTERRRAGDERRRGARALPAGETAAPYNTNQFLMEIHAPEPEPRTRDSSFSVDSEENYLYSLPEDEEEFLTKEFSSVYEDAACERLAGLSKTELMQEYLALEARYESVARGAEAELQRRLREREQQFRDLELANEKLRQKCDRLRRRRRGASSASSADSESDSSSSSCSSHSTCSATSTPAPTPATAPLPPLVNGICNGAVSPEYPLVNGFHAEPLQNGADVEEV